MANPSKNTCSLNVQQAEPCYISPAEKIDKEFYHLSNLDKNLTFFVKTIYSFKAANCTANVNVVEVMKSSLGKVLVYYYPLAGRLAVGSDGKLLVNCNGEGVVFVEAEADCSLDGLGDMSVPDASIGDKLVYHVNDSISVLDSPLLMIQVTKFNCGGFILGVTMNHCMCDGMAAMEFVKCWGEMARGLQLSIPPILDRTTFFKPRSPLNMISGDEVENSEIAMKITSEPNEEELFASFCFSEDKLAELKQKVASDAQLSVSACSTFQALTAHVWKARTQALNLHPDQITKVELVVDTRSRINPPLPKGYFGNGVILSNSICKAGDLNNSPLSFAVKLVQQSIEKVTDDYIRSVIDYLEVAPPRLPSSSRSSFIINTWTKLALESTDFGWGQPTFLWPASLPNQDEVLLLPYGADRKGITVNMGLPASAMKIFKELIGT